MKGDNTIRLSDASVIEAIEYWLNKTQFQVDSAVTVKTFEMRKGYIHVEIAQKSDSREPSK